ncbi:MAG: hypothetical protein ACREBV_07430, partial [Candidatus Zixiibacteriota bacterium]
MKNIFIGIILSSFLLSSRPNVQAQGSLLKGGESGIGFLGSYARTSETSAIQATAIGTLAGTLDLGVFVG